MIQRILLIPFIAHSTPCIYNSIRQSMSGSFHEKLLSVKNYSSLAHETWHGIRVSTADISYTSYMQKRPML